MATIDASIPLGVRPVEMPNPLAQFAQMAQIQGAQQQNALLQLKMDEAARQREDENALRAGLSAPGADPYQVLLRRGRVEDATKYQKAQGEAAKQKVELVDAKLKQSRAFLDSVRTPEQYLEWHRANHSDPILGPELAARGVTAEQSMAAIQQALSQPGGFEDLLRKSALGLEKFTELNKPTTSVVNAGGTSQVLQTPGLGGAPKVVSTVQHTATPGELMTDARVRAEGAANRAQSERHFQVGQNAPRGEVKETESGLVLVDPRSGTSRPVLGPDGQPLKGKAANRQLTEGQGKSTAFAMRAIEAENQLETLGAYNPSVVDRLALGAPMDVGRGFASDKAQKYDTSKRNFIASILRKETGAAVTKPEFEMYDKMYFPQVGDRPEQLADKKRQRDLALAGLLAEAGPGREVVNENVQRKAGAPAAAPAAPGIDALLKKYGGK